MFNLSQATISIILFLYRMEIKKKIAVLDLNQNPNPNLSHDHQEVVIVNDLEVQVEIVPENLEIVNVDNIEKETIHQKIHGNHAQYLVIVTEKDRVIEVVEIVPENPEIVKGNAKEIGNENVKE